MTRHLNSFPSLPMDFPEDELADVVEAAHDVIREATRAGGPCIR